jgi:8-oxo-dGTP pyrophosphatase MutT (NUDIX family)
MSVFFRPSAGAIVVRPGHSAQMLVLEQVRRDGERQAVAPKGGIESHENTLEAGFREVGEETGISGLTLFGYLGQQRFSFCLDDGQPGEKTVDWFLMQADGDALTPAAAEGFGTARWYPFAEARRQLSHPAFLPFVDKAERIVTWRATHPASVPPDMGRAVTEFAHEAHGLCGAHGQTALVLCGSAARGDYVHGWSDLDFVAYTSHDSAALATQLAALAKKVEDRYGIHVAARVGDLGCHEVTAGGPLYEMKLRAVARRVGVDSVLLSGHWPDLLDPLPPEDLAADLDVIAAAARQLLSEGGRSRTVLDAQRRALSVLCSASRLTAAGADPHASLLLPDVAALIDQRWPGLRTPRMLRHYSALRTTASISPADLADLAQTVPEALDELRDTISAAASV